MCWVFLSLRDWGAGCSAGPAGLEAWRSGQALYPIGKQGTSVLLRSGSDFDARIEVDLTLRLHGHNGTVPWTGRTHTVGLHATEVEFDGTLDAPEDRIDRFTCGHTTGQIRNRGPPVATRILVDTDEIPNSSHHLAPLRAACRFTDAKVPLGMLDRLSRWQILQSDTAPHPESLSRFRYSPEKLGMML